MSAKPWQPLDLSQDVLQRKDGTRSVRASKQCDPYTAPEGSSCDRLAGRKGKGERDREHAADIQRGMATVLDMHLADHCACMHGD